MENPPSETVIIVHGTWAAPKPNERRWYQTIDGQPDNKAFTARLDAALQDRASPARCWAHCTDENPAFQWSGDNHWIARTQASSALGDYVAKLRTEGWRCHIVAHSHGGNVMLEALPQIMNAAGSEQPQGKLATLGTPFLDTISPISQSTKRRHRFLEIVSWVVCWLLWALVAFVLVAGSMKDNLTAWDIALNQVLGGLAAVFLLSVHIGVWRRSFRRGIEQPFNKAGQNQPQLLVLGSPVDEAWQILHHLRSADNPMASDLHLFPYLLSSVRSNRSQRAMVARINGAKSYRDLGKFTKLLLVFMHALGLVAVGVAYWMSKDLRNVWLFVGAEIALVFVVVLLFTQLLSATFFSAFWSPFRWCVQQAGALASVFPAMATYGVRSLGWSVLQKMSMGLESYQFKIPLVEQCPSALGKEFFKYEDMPSGAQQRALDKRSGWIARHLGDVSQTFSNLVVTADDLRKLQRAVEEDQTLVHAAYYNDDECIARIADWIAGRG